MLNRVHVIEIAKACAFFVHIKKLLMAKFLSNGLHEKVMMCYTITKSRLDVQFAKKIPLEIVIGQQ